MRVYSRKEVGDMAGVNARSIVYAETLGRVPAGDIQFGEGVVYSEELCKKIVEHFSKRPTWERKNKSLNNKEAQ